MPTVKAGDGATLHYAVHDYTDRWRKAETIILIHGFARSGEFWFNMVPYLARFYRVICPDLRGLGQSTPLNDPAHALSLAAYVGDIEAVADHAGASNFHLVGEAIGGAIASIAQFVAEGKAKCLLLTTARRFATLPDVESLEDVKMAQAQTLLWRAVIAPRDIPQDRFEKLRDVLTRAAQTPEFKTMAAKRGEEVWVISAEDAAKYAQSEFVQMEQLARELRLKPN